MNKLKDIIYDKNDMVIALIIVVLAGFLIYNRIDVIMDYPSVLAAEASSGNVQVTTDTGEGVDNDQTTADEEPTQDKPTDPANHTGDTDNQGGGQDSVAGQTTGEPAKSQVSIYIEYGATGDQIAQILIDSGLIDSKGAFYDAVSAAGADTKLQAGSFIIPSDATPAEIIALITR